jgi:hypothetical protein
MGQWGPLLMAFKLRLPPSDLKWYFWNSKDSLQEREIVTLQ